MLKHATFPITTWAIQLHKLPISANSGIYVAIPSSNNTTKSSSVGESDVPVYVIVLAGVGAVLGLVSSILSVFLICCVIRKNNISKASSEVLPPFYDNIE